MKSRTPNESSCTLHLTSAGERGGRPPKRILHILDHSWPILDGYAQRSRSLVVAQQQLDLDPCVLTGPLHELDDLSSTEIFVDGIKYYRTVIRGQFAARSIQNRWNVLREFCVVRLLRLRISKVLDSEAFDVLHAHSPALCGLAALQATRSRGIPFVYEIRSFWEDSNISEPKTAWQSLRYQLSRKLETYVLRHADAVVGISSSMLAEIEARGVAAEGLFHVPNGVDTARFVPRARDTVLAQQLGIKDIPTLGYLGTFFPWEGVSWLVNAVVDLRQRGLEFRLLLIGDGTDAASVKRAIAEYRCEDYILYLGRIPHEQVERYYSAIDILVYPRLRSRITELVTPLKPLEGMALGKAVLASDVGGIRELIIPEITGLIFRAGDKTDFADQAERLLRDPFLRDSLGSAARKTVTTEKNWKNVVGTYKSVYVRARQSAEMRARSNRRQR